ncbi:MAG: hypothetical protein P4L22_00390 [Candidatus Babeliales bacterium]|nr:hypothetical protein [Candidatus Babeliales bacterium]
MKKLLVSIIMIFGVFYGSEELPQAPGGPKGINQDQFSNDLKEIYESIKYISYLDSHLYKAKSQENTQKVINKIDLLLKKGLNINTKSETRLVAGPILKINLLDLAHWERIKKLEEYLIKKGGELSEEMKKVKTEIQNINKEFQEKNLKNPPVVS